jgi:putative Mg2+ transporter-C (MgtC) family protein
LVTENHRLDVSRIAAQVVSGIGFIGAGMIIFQKNAIRGLTTAAGVWVTAAIGLTCGAGMYLLAVSSTFMVLLGLEAFNFFDWQLWLLRSVCSAALTMVLMLAIESVRSRR